MWTVWETPAADKSLRRVPSDVTRRYEAWKRVVEQTGPVGLKAIRGFRDEALKGKWFGYRSSRLGIQWRVIYRIEGTELEVWVIEVNPHEY